MVSVADADGGGGVSLSRVLAAVALVCLLVAGTRVFVRRRRHPPADVVVTS